MADSQIANKTVVITGANTGIGLETARDLARKKARVVICARNRQKAEAAVADVKRTSGNDDVRLVLFDLASQASIRAGAEELLGTCERIDVLVNNAGLVLGERQTTADGFEATFGINHLGPFLLTHLLLDRLKASAPARIINVSSRAHTRVGGIWFDDLMVERRRYVSFQVYCHSKLANVLFTRELARRIEGSGVVTHALHPGVVATDFGSSDDLGGIFGFFTKLARPFMISPADGAKTTLHCVLSEEAGKKNGGYWSDSAPKEPSAAGRDDAAASRLWAESVRLLGL
ncbi:MAG: SDR family oxidoreductase [Polyangiaceae bacterium]|nr:SDR family oxidoreductase [Polyangiaceae bacterium]